MADETPVASEPRGNKTIIMILAAAGIVFLLIFLFLFSGIFKENATNKGNSNSPTTNQGRAVP